MINDSLLSLEDVADRLHKSARWLRDWLRKNPADPNGDPFYIRAGRTMIFTEKDVERICASLREEERCRLNLSRRARAKRRTGMVVARTSANTLTEALRLANER